MKQFIFECKVPMRWKDMDAFNHVNNSVYFTYFEQARALWWEHLGLKLENKTEGPILVTASCAFLKPLVFPATLIIKLYADPPGRSSCLIHYEIYTEKNPQTLYAEGQTKVVWLDYQTHKAKSLPDFFRKHLPQSP